MKRALQTAQIIGDKVEIVVEFMARDHGEATGKTTEEIKRLFPNGIPGQESLESVQSSSSEKV